MKTSHIHGEKKKKNFEVELKKKFGNRRQRFRRCVRPLKEKAYSLRQRKIKIYKKKIRHYRETQTQPFMSYDRKEKEHDPTVVPYRLRKYGALSIFGCPEDLLLPLNPLGPFICTKDVKISPEEMLILQKDPKFSVRNVSSKNTFQVETEKNAEQAQI